MSKKERDLIASEAEGPTAADLDGSVIPTFKVLGTRLSITSIEQVLKLFECDWTAYRRDRYIVFRDVHGVMRARSILRLRVAHEQSDLIVPDGMPLAWVGKLAGIKGVSRIPGPDFMPAVCERGIALGWRHFFLGGVPGVVDAMIRNLTERYPGIAIAGSISPPFGTLSPEEDENISAAIRRADVDFVWVGLGTPKQEIWMHEHRGRCGGAIMLGVGAAFDFHAGVKTRAPEWMQQHGLEWLYRLVQEPTRLWARYLVLAPKFALLAAFELLGNGVTVESKPSINESEEAVARKSVV